MKAAVPNSAPPTAIQFDRVDTLVCFPGITTDGDGHMACLGRLYRELGVYALDLYTEVKNVFVDISD